MKFSYNDFARLYKINHMKRKSPKIKTFTEALKDVSVFIETLKEILRDNNFDSLNLTGLGDFNKIEKDFTAVHPITHRKKTKKQKVIEFTPDFSLIKIINSKDGKE